MERQQVQPKACQEKERCKYGGRARERVGGATRREKPAKSRAAAAHAEGAAFGALQQNRNDERDRHQKLEYDQNGLQKGLRRTLRWGSIDETACIGKRGLKGPRRTPPTARKKTCQTMGTGWHPHALSAAPPYVARQAEMIARKSAALRLAPPTSAPSTSLNDKISLALVALTDPP